MTSSRPGATEHSSLPSLEIFSISMAAIVLMIVLAVCASQYGFDRDELYFRMLPAAWGYVDQPPLAPWLARFLTQTVADEPWAIRIPAIMFAVVSVPIIALIAREAGGSRVAQGLAAWATPSDP